MSGHPQAGRAANRHPDDDLWIDRLVSWVGVAQHEASRVLDILHEGDHCGAVMLSGDELVEVRRRLRVVIESGHEVKR